ncbi:MAG: hypothetical protein K5648_08980 [Erysipelotrichaceae bacterium]|nr:hypothetical protein [Erysipelotrichaceae bacterium]
MLLTVFLALVCCTAITLLLTAAVVFVQEIRFFSSAPKEVRALLKPRDEELFPGARPMGWVLMILSMLAIAGAFVIAVRDGLRSGFTFIHFFLRFVSILSIYKAYDMIFFDWFLLCRFHFFQYFFPETAPALQDRKYGFNIKSQLLKLFVVFPTLSALAAWICTLFSLGSV